MLQILNLCCYCDAFRNPSS